jgi:hypothetical protein
MAASRLEICRSVPAHRRREGLRFELVTVLLYAMLGMVAGVNSYRQLHEFIRAHRRRLNRAFGLHLRYAPSCSGLRLICKGLIRWHWKRRFADMPTAMAVDGNSLRGSLDAFCNREAAHMLWALCQADQIVLGHRLSRRRAISAAGCTRH